MESFKWLIRKNKEKIRKKCMLYAIALSALFIAFQKSYGLVLTACIIFISLLIVYNRALYQSYIENGVVVLIIYKNMNQVIRILNRESIIKSFKVLLCVVPIILLHDFIAIHENFSKPVYRLLIDVIILLIISMLLSTLHIYLLFMLNTNSNKFADVLFLFISTFIFTVYKIDLKYLLIYYLIFIFFLIALLLFAKKRISKEKIMLM